MEKPSPLDKLKYLVTFDAMQFNSRLAFEVTERQRHWQASALRSLLPYVEERSHFYQKRFKEAAANISAIKSLEDLRFLPTTDKTDMQRQNWEFLCVNNRDIKEYTATSGTLGDPVTIGLTERDLQRLAYNEHQSFLCADGKPDDIYQLILTLDKQFMAGIAYYLGIRQLGAAVVRTGAGLPHMQWSTIERLQSNTIVTVPSFILKMIDWANEHGVDLKRSPVTKAICIGESLRTADFELNTLGQKIYNQWNIKLYNTYASTEMQTAFTECSAGAGGHEQPDLIILEIVDDHGNPLKEGEYGEVTITTLGVEGMPLVRYRTGDICCFYETPCSCGRKSRRLSPVLGRKQQMIKYKGTTLYPPAIFEILNHLDFVTEYVVEVFTNDLGTDEVRLHLCTQLTHDDCETKIRPLLQSQLRVTPLLSFCSAREIHELQFPAASRKQVKFIDNRK